MHVLDQPRVTARNGTADKCTHICICNDGTGVRPSTTRTTKRLGTAGVGGHSWLMMNWLSSFCEGPLFLLLRPKGSGLHRRLHAHPTPVTYDGTPIRRFWTNTRQMRCGQQHPFPWPRPRRCLHGDQAFVLSCCSIGSATDTCVHTHVNVP